MTHRPVRRTATALARSRTAAVLALALAGCAAVPASAAGPRAVAATHSCHVPSYPGQGYFTSLRVSGTSCRTGTKVTLDYYKCRTRHGKAGTCHSSVDGYSCSERRNSIPTEIEARVTCRRGAATVVHTYQQNL
jgi:uncharacterized membrane protein